MIFILIIHLILLAKTMFTAWPEMLLWPYLILSNWLPYKDIAIAHTPLLLGFLAGFFKITGLGILQLKIFTWILILFTDILLFWIIKKLWNSKMAYITVANYVFLQLYFEGNGLWFDLALTPLILLSYYLLRIKKYFWSGTFWSLALITKQTAIWFIVPIIMYFLQEAPLRDRSLKVKKFLFGVLLILLMLLLLLILFGIADDFYFWAVKFGILYLPRAEGQVQLPALRQLIASLTPFIPVIFVPELIPWVIAGIMGAYPRWGLFHLQPALPFLAIVIGTLLTKFKKFKNGYIFLIYILPMTFLFSRFLIRNWRSDTRFFEPEVQKLIKVVNDNASADKKLFVLDYWDNIYPLTRTVPATRPWFPYLPWYLSFPGTKPEILGDLISRMPELIVVGTYHSYNWSEIGEILKYYNCDQVSSEALLCRKNK